MQSIATVSSLTICYDGYQKGTWSDLASVELVRASAW
jgi:hypothetical protein